MALGDVFCLLHAGFYEETGYIPVVVFDSLEAAAFLYFEIFEELALEGVDFHQYEYIIIWIYA